VSLAVTLDSGTSFACIAAVFDSSALQVSNGEDAHAGYRHARLIGSSFAIPISRFRRMRTSMSSHDTPSSILDEAAGHAGTNPMSAVNGHSNGSGVWSPSNATPIAGGVPSAGAPQSLSSGKFHPLVASAMHGGGKPAPGGAFAPKEPETFQQVGIPEAYIEALVFKHLAAVGSNTCRGMARDLAVPGKPLVEMMADLKNRQLVVYKGSAAMGDFDYTLTDAGRARASRFLEECSYCGAAPVPFEDYVKAVAAQTISTESPGPEQLREAFSDLLMDKALLDRLGPAINSGRGLFLFGFPGNGKTSIAERITSCFGSTIWIPRAIFVEGETIQFFDPQCHEAVTGEKPAATSIVKGQSFDARWVKIKRPTIVVGGELTMDALEIKYNPNSKISEPSIQMKSNGGTLVIDDFGRQRMDPVELLNRWIVPLEKRHDYLTLNNGKKIQVPFDQLIVFSTNLEPKQLVDDAFLRRIPYKINISDPTEEEFRSLMKIVAKQFDVEYNEAAVDHLIEVHYRQRTKPFRCCHPRDLILQIVNQAKFRSEKPVMSVESLDFACGTYFAIM